MPPRPRPLSGQDGSRAGRNASSAEQIAGPSYLGEPTGKGRAEAGNSLSTGETSDRHLWGREKAPETKSTTWVPAQPASAV